MPSPRAAVESQTHLSHSKSSYVSSSPSSNTQPTSVGASMLSQTSKLVSNGSSSSSSSTSTSYSSSSSSSSSPASQQLSIATAGTSDQFLPAPRSSPKSDRLSGNGSVPLASFSKIAPSSVVVCSSSTASSVLPPAPSSSSSSSASSSLTTISASPPSSTPTGSSALSAQQSPGSSRVIKSSLTPGETLSNPSLASLLTPYEQSEILEFSHIYFVGALPVSGKIQGIPHHAHNSGYDDERGDYRVTVRDHLEYRYEVLSSLGKGSFGLVLRCLDHKKDMVVALKIIRNKKRFHHQALVEVKILEHLMAMDREHRSHIVRVYGYFYFRNHLCITFEPLALNLYEFIKSNSFQGLSLGLIRRFAIQLLTALAFLSSQKIIHCDLKPENILLKSLSKSAVKLIDFGSSCFENERVYTYIQSRFYRSPEVLLGLPYTCAIDMWSLGAILSELHTGYPLFPGENEHEQLLCQMEVLGLPPRRMVLEASRRKQFFDASGAPLLAANSHGKVRVPGSKPIETAVKCKDALFLSFIRKCLRWEPSSRLTPEQALAHDWIREKDSANGSSSSAGTPPWLSNSTANSSSSISVTTAHANASNSSNSSTHQSYPSASSSSSSSSSSTASSPSARSSRPHSPHRGINNPAQSYAAGSLASSLKERDKDKALPATTVSTSSLPRTSQTQSSSVKPIPQTGRYLVDTSAGYPSVAPTSNAGNRPFFPPIATKDSSA